VAGTSVDRSAIRARAGHQPGFAVPGAAVWCSGGVAGNRASADRVGRGQTRVYPPSHGDRCGGPRGDAAGVATGVLEPTWGAAHRTWRCDRDRLGAGGLGRSPRSACPGGSRSAMPRGTRPAAGSPAAGCCRDTTAARAHAAHRGTSSVLPRDSLQAHRAIFGGLRATGETSGQVVAKLVGQRGFAPLPRRWVVERTHAWITATAG
jgi:hypothetical protein